MRRADVGGFDPRSRFVVTRNPAASRDAPAQAAEHWYSITQNGVCAIPFNRLSPIPKATYPPIRGVPTHADSQEKAPGGVVETSRGTGPLLEQAGGVGKLTLEICHVVQPIHDV